MAANAMLHPEWRRQELPALPVPCSVEVQNVWGPQVSGCGSDFDLTLLFQEAIFFIAPLTLALLLAGFRIWQLWRRETIVGSLLLYRLKLGGYGALILLQAALLAVPLTRLTIAASALGFVGAIVFFALSHLEHRRSIRGSTILIMYLGYAFVAEALRARTLWSMPRENTPVAAVVTVLTVLKFALFVLETCNKTVQPGVRRPTPDERAHIISRLFLWWLMPVFRLGKQQPRLTSETLPDIELELTKAGGLDPCRPSSRDNGDLLKPSILGHLVAVRKWLLLSAVPPRLCYSGFLFAQPFLVRRATDWLSAPVDQNTYKIGAALVAAYVIVYVGIGATQAFYRQCTARAITAIRADLVSKIHGHSLKLNASSSPRDAASTLMSADVERFVVGSREMHECWACTLQLGIALFLLEREMGVATAAAGGITATFVILTGLIAGTAGKRQNIWLETMQTRIAGTTKVLSVMKGIKMTGVGQAIRRDLIALRKAEVRKMRAFRYILLVVLWAMWIPVIMAPILAFTVYKIVVAPSTGEVLTPAKVYQCLTILTIFGSDVAMLLQSAVNVVTGIASLRRIEEFLLGDNKRLDKRILLPTPGGATGDDDDADDRPLISESPRSSLVRRRSAGIRMQRIRQSLHHAPATLRLMRAQAGWNSEGPFIVHDADLEVDSPHIVAVVGPIGSGKTTLLQLLLGETQRADGVVAISTKHFGYCSQTPWLTHTSIRDNIVGSDAFDEQWYETVVAATALQKDFSAMALGDSTLVGSGGSTLSGGQKKRVALARAIYSKAPVLILDDPFNGLDGRTEAAVLQTLLGPQGLLRERRTLVIWATSTVRQARFADRIVSLTDSGSVERDSVLMRDVRRSRYSALLGDVSEAAFDLTNGANPRLSTVEVVSGIMLGEDPSADVQMPSKDPVAYRYYVGGGGKRKFVIFLCIICVFVASATGSQVWVVRWAENNVIDPNRLQALFIGIYFAIGSIQLIAWTGAALFFMRTIAEKAADRCYEALLDTVLSAPMSFFDSTAAGKTINRFSQDIQFIDTELPYNLMGFVTQTLMAIGHIAIIVYGAPWSGVAVPIVAFAVYLLQRAYLPTSRQLRILEIEAKAPLFSHFLETLSGLATIRAMRWTGTYADKNQAAIVTSQKPFYLLFAAQNWLNLGLDMVTAGLAVTIMAVGVATRASASSTLGLALFSASSFGGTAKNVIQHWTQLEINMGAVERVRSFTMDTASERPPAPSPGAYSPLGLRKRSWGGSGSIRFYNVSARYTPDLPLVLRDISFEIHPGQRYAICGRTGSGKSTLLSTLLRLMPLSGGTILVDETDLSNLDPDDVRSRFITLPQDPVLIAGTVRHNMRLYVPDLPDEKIIAALDSFGLWDTIHAKGGLDVDVTDELLSHGQRQLFCLARSTLQHGNIVILDEPSSQADAETVQKIDEAIREKFERRTVLCVAHKLSTIMSFDHVLVMDSGELAECGNPQELLDDPESLFSRLMRSSSRPEENVQSMV